MLLKNFSLIFYRLGFAAEAYPRKIIPSEVILSVNGKTKNIFDYEDKLEFYDQIIEFLQTIFFKYAFILFCLFNLYKMLISLQVLAR